ncbi:hypothetical protein FOCC_FOCC016530 [Frankliniella occidentalis]|nr:hypothetical protein FOCC_FOCC016530 [Frankliniella occidentalis]
MRKHLRSAPPRMDLAALRERHPVVSSIINSITSEPSAANPCLAFWINSNITNQHARCFADRIYELDFYFKTAYLDTDARGAKRESAKASLVAKLDIPSTWQIERILILQEPTEEYKTAFSLVQVHRLIGYLHGKAFVKHQIIDILAELVSTAFTPSSPVTPSAPPFVDLVSPINGEHSTKLTPATQDLHKQLNEALHIPQAAPRGSKTADTLKPDSSTPASSTTPSLHSSTISSYKPPSTTKVAYTAILVAIPKRAATIASGTRLHPIACSLPRLPHSTPATAIVSRELAPETDFPHGSKPDRHNASRRLRTACTQEALRGVALRSTSSPPLSTTAG